MAPEQLIAMAWYIEDGSKQYSEAIKDLTQDQDIIDIITSLTDHKIAHKKSLLQLFQKISGRAAEDDFPESVLKRPPQRVMAGCVSVPEAITWSKDKGITDILDLLMALEANTLDLYLKLASQVKPDSAKSVFMELSVEQTRHIEKLASIFEKTI